ncbi:MAG: putative bifunctional diguanylate cyclase/phosphodiesterase, partial [Hyphomonadaceae bacterium]
GTLGLALLAPVSHLIDGGRIAQLAVQALGVGLNFVWSFGIGLAFFALLNLFTRIRVSSEAETQGLNEAEHGTRLGIGHVEQAFGSLVSGSPDLETRLDIEPGDEAENLTRIFNALMENLQNEEQARRNDTEIARSEAEAERMSALANTTFEALCISVGGAIVDANAAFSELVAAPIGSLKGRNVLDFIAHDRAEDRALIETLDGSGHCEITVISAQGDRIPVEVRSREILYRGHATRLLALSDLRERKKAEEQIRYLAQHDALSNLPNRALFNERLAALTERASQEGFLSAVMLIDLDRFKDINDLYGHQAGDEVIKVTAERLRAAIRQGDMAARLGGDEFAILQVGINFANQAADLAHRLVQDLSGPIPLPNGSVLRPGASIGVSICPRDGADAPTLISRADTALYHAKHSGRNTFSVFETGMDAENRRRQMLEADLADALDRGEFELFYQPRLRLSDSEIVSYEALLRWRHPVRGMIAPGEFISVAEQSGRIIAIGDWVLRTACKNAMEELGAATVSVNVSPLQFRERNFLERVSAALTESGLPPSRLEIEITEGTLIADDKRAIELLLGLKNLGVEIALDDFGTGYSSLGYLSRFPFNTLKIDRSFVSGLADNANSRAIVDTVLRLGRALDMCVVAEGVEEMEELRLLADLGCDEAQGYLIGRPVALSAALRAAPTAVARALGREPSEHSDPQLRAVQALQRRVEALLSTMPVDHLPPARARARRTQG